MTTSSPIPESPGRYQWSASPFGSASRHNKRAVAAIVIASLTVLASVSAGNALRGVANSASVNVAGERLATRSACVSAPSAAAYLSGGYDALRGGDYQRALRLDSQRTLWTLQDAYVFDGRENVLVHNVAVLQDGLCFTLLHYYFESWLFASATVPRSHWFWILDGYRNTSGVHLFVAEMASSGDYLAGTVQPVANWVVTLDPITLSVRRIQRAGDPSADLFGWSVTTDSQWVYQYSWCYRQFGWAQASGSPFGFDTRCTNQTLVARLPVNADPSSPPTYWDGRGWSSNRSLAVSIFGPTNTARGIANPVDVVYDQGTYRLISKPDDWWGSTVYTYHSSSPTGPWVIDGAKDVIPLCANCNTYFASWVPGAAGAAQTWSISNNHWSIVDTPYFGPTFFTTSDLGPP